MPFTKPFTMTGTTTGVIAARGSAYRLSRALALSALAASGLSLLAPDLLSGPEVSQGNLRGTALVVVLLAVPILLGAMRHAARGSARAVVVWLAAVGYLLYQAVMFVFATPYNSLFLLYIAMLGLAIWSVVALAMSIDLAAFGDRFDDGAPARGIAVFAWALAGLNALAWLATIVPATFSDDPGSFLDGSGMTTNPVYVQDLTLWLPLLAAGAWWLWQERPWGGLVTGALLSLLWLEGIGVATDQWFGATADPGTAFASFALVPAFLVLTVTLSVPLFFYYRSLDSDPAPSVS